MATFTGYGGKVWIGDPDNGGKLLGNIKAWKVTTPSTTATTKPLPKRFTFAGQWHDYLKWLRALTRLPLVPVGRN